MTAPFTNEPLAELRRASERDVLIQALGRLDERLPLDVGVIVDGEVRSAPSLESVDPGDPSRVVARFTAAGPADVDAAIAAAQRAQPEWGARSAQDRAAVLSRAAGELRSMRQELVALQVRECGKPWDQGDGEVSEAIDFLEYYAAQAVALDQGRQLTQPPGEHNTMVYRPRGVVAVIAPWNFPVAIPTGMTAAALVTGNAAILKPAEQSPACAHATVTALHRAGVPAGVLALLPGEGDVGAALVAHPGVHTIAFTGSQAVGREIIQAAARPAEGQDHLKRVVAEMGGKNCMIVDYDADLDDVVPALLQSAFSFAGQKCSAASRVLVHERIFDALAERVRGALETLQVGPADEFGTDVGPVIEPASRDRIERALADAGASASVHRVAEIPSGDGYWVAPAIVTGAAADSPVIVDELFGPVVTLEPVASIAAACDIVDGQRYALTGGLFTRNPHTIDEVVRRSPVGNLYVNRGTTGAMVGRQPFGGNRLSGTGTKAGGPDYLLAFVEPLVVSENTVRHGLSV